MKQKKNAFFCWNSIKRKYLVIIIFGCCNSINCRWISVDNMWSIKGKAREQILWDHTHSYTWFLKYRIKICVLRQICYVWNETILCNRGNRSIKFDCFSLLGDSWLPRTQPDSSWEDHIDHRTAVCRRSSSSIVLYRFCTMKLFGLGGWKTSDRLQQSSRLIWPYLHSLPRLYYYLWS